MDAPAAKAQLVITWNGPPAGVQVTGPIQDKMLCYALLELAKDAIRDFKPSTIVAPDIIFPRGVS